MPTSVAHSDKKAPGSIVGSTGDIVAVTCDPGYYGSGDVTCQADGTFTSLICTGVRLSPLLNLPPLQPNGWTISPLTTYPRVEEYLLNR